MYFTRRVSFHYYHEAEVPRVVVGPFLRSKQAVYRFWRTSAEGPLRHSIEGAMKRCEFVTLSAARGVACAPHAYSSRRHQRCRRRRRSRRSRRQIDRSEQMPSFVSGVCRTQGFERAIGADASAARPAFQT